MNVEGPIRVLVVEDSAFPSADGSRTVLESQGYARRYRPDEGLERLELAFEEGRFVRSWSSATS